MVNQAALIKDFIIKNLSNHEQDIVKIVGEKFGVTKTTVHRHINSLIKEGKLVKSGNTKNIRYYLQGIYERVKDYSLAKPISEDEIFTRDFSDIFKSLKPNVYKVCSFGVTEMLNNAIDHSQGSIVSLSTRYSKPYLSIVVKDDGLGAFKKICNYLHIPDIREGILHLSKGKITSDPRNHSGQGIFFTSRMFDEFSISANGFTYTRFNIQNDWSLVSSNNVKGTEVQMIMNIESGINIANIFQKYQGDDFGFDRTEIMVNLAKYNEENLMSRSQAKRILIDLDKFSIITLDFRHISFVGQGFVDEIFRVFKNAHPHIEIQYINTNSDVQFMIERGVKSA